MLRQTLAEEPLTALGIASNDELISFLRSHVFLPYWKELYVDHIFPEQEPARIKHKARHRGPPLKDVQEAILQAEQEGQRKYTVHNPDRANWGAVDHYARFLLQVLAENVLDRDGIFYGKHVSGDDMDVYLWSLCLLVDREHTRSRIHRSMAGWHLLALSPQE